MVGNPTSLLFRGANFRAFVGQRHALGIVTGSTGLGCCIVADHWAPPVVFTGLGVAVLSPCHEALRVESYAVAPVLRVVVARQRAGLPVPFLCPALNLSCGVRAGKFISFTGASTVSGTACVAGVVPACDSVATVDGARVKLALTPGVAIAVALVLPGGIAGATQAGISAALLPHTIPVNVSILVIRGRVAIVLVGGAGYGTRIAVIGGLAPAAPRVSAQLLKGGVAWATAIHRGAALVSSHGPVRFTTGQVGDAVAQLLVVSASDWARVSLGSAPAVAPGVSALVFPLGIARATLSGVGTELGLRSRPIHFSCRIVDIGIAISFLVGARDRAASPRLVPAVGRPLVLAHVLCLFIALDCKGIIAALCLWVARLVATALTLDLPLLVARASVFPGGTGIVGDLVGCIPINFSIGGVD